MTLSQIIGAALPRRSTLLVPGTCVNATSNKKARTDSEILAVAEKVAIAELAVRKTLVNVIYDDESSLGCGATITPPVEGCSVLTASKLRSIIKSCIK